VPYDATMLLADARQIAGSVGERQERNIESVAKADKVRGFIRCIDVEHAGEVPRLIGDDAYGPPCKARKAGDDIFRIIGLHFEKSEESTSLPMMSRTS